MRNAGRCRSLVKKLRRSLLPVGIGMGVILAAFCAAAEESISDATAVKMEKMVVVGSHTATDQPEEMSVPVQVVTGEQLQEIGAISMQQAVEALQGVELVQCPDLNASPGVQTLRMRGMDANQVLVLIDGRRQAGSRPDNQGYSYTDVSNISIDNIERIEVLRDGASAQYGSDAVAGVINIVTRKSNPRLSVNSQYGLSARGDGEEKALDVSGGAPVGSRLFVNANAFGKKIDHYNRTPDTPRWTSPDIEQKGANLKLFWDIDYRQVLDADVRLNKTDTVLRSGATGNLPKDRISKKNDLYGGLNWEGDFSPVTCKIGGGLSSSENEYRHSEDPDYNGDLDSELVDVYGNANYQATSWLSIFAGGSYNREREDSPQRDFVESREVAAAFAELQFAFFDRLNLQVSGRLEHYSDFDSHFAPKISGRIELFEGLALRASVSTTYQVPTLFQLHDRFIGAMSGTNIYGNPDLDPAEGIAVNAGLVWKPFRQHGLQFTVDGFQNKIDDLIESKTTGETSSDGNVEATYVNISGTSTFEGVEVEMALPLAYGFRLDVAANYLEATDPDGEDLTNRPRCGLNAKLAYRFGERFSANLRYTYRGKYLDDRDPHNKIEPFDFFSAHASYAVTKRISIYLGARNLFDEKPPVDPEDYESGHMESMLDSVEGAYYYGGVRLNF
ncbi:TonB-dependent receptor [uncultured Desulfosarcina sp.]|uniref:TonB-dependent receptor plug domain-containing protein n=1 Tax=uncultured Desulfosarcina sp. TaxID=218289 RepID=UPI0029C7E078|nr:TonB-dependent receptor [uncultured Desulfosarcina sp.]